MGEKDIGIDLTDVDVNKLDDAALLEMAKSISSSEDSNKEWMGKVDTERRLLEQQLVAAGY